MDPDDDMGGRRGGPRGQRRGGRPDDESEARPDAQYETRAKIRAEARFDDRSDDQFEGRPNAQSEAGHDDGSEDQSETRSKTQAEARSDDRSDHQFEARRGGPVIAVCGLAFEAAIAAGRGVVPLVGPGPGRIAAQLEALLSGPEQDWAGVMSFGCAAGLDPALAPGTCVLAAGVHTPAWRLAADPDWLQALRARLPQARSSWLAGVDAPLASPADKERLWHASGAGIADMESHAAALAARRHGLPFAACRVVLDPAARSVPPSALAGVSGDGRTAWLALLRSLAGAPRQLGAMRALARDAWRARRTLRRVRARLGTALAVPPH